MKKIVKNLCELFLKSLITVKLITRPVLPHITVPKFQGIVGSMLQGKKRPMYRLFVSKVNTKKADLCAELLWGPSVWFLWEQECPPCLSEPRTGVPQCPDPKNQTHSFIGCSLAAVLSHWSMPPELIRDTEQVSHSAQVLKIKHTFSLVGVGGRAVSLVNAS